MKLKNDIWLNVVFMLFGAFVSYILSQFEFLEIDTKVNVLGTLISFTTVGVGLYLAISLKRLQTRTLNLHNYLQPRLDAVWESFIKFSYDIYFDDKLEFTDVTKSITEILQKVIILKKLFETIDLYECGIDDLKRAIEKFEVYLVDECEIEDNLINFSKEKLAISSKLDEIHSLFASSLKSINRIT